ncbi:hypothetical protein R1flu_028568 [Riccia fluitans]|uniref:Uncharacterized protein n=1 Tax=Riccia fluitans TaxID=41844 RepID=A0ABD1XM20_9MARC
MLAISVLTYGTVILFLTSIVTAGDNEQPLVSVIIQAELGEHDVVDISCTASANGTKAEKVLRSHEAREKVPELASGSIVCNFHMIGPVVGQKYAFHVPVWLGVLETGFLCGTELVYRCLSLGSVQG